MPSFDAAVLIGRFEPFHRGHLGLLRGALATAPMSIVVVGSSHQARTPRNPFSAAERMDMIRSALPPDEAARLRFVPMRDYWNAERWAAAVVQAVHALVPDHTRLALVGYRKDDDTGDYLDGFPDWNYVWLPRQGDIDATTIREALLGRGDLETVAPLLPASVLAWLRAWSRTPVCEELRQEWRSLEEERLRRGCERFQAVDTLVRTNNSALLVQRAIRPGKGLWALPGTLLEKPSDLVDTARTGVLTETGISLTGIVPERVELFAHPSRSLRGRIETHVHLFRLPCEAPLHPGPAIAAARWVPFGELPSLEESSFEDHHHILRGLLEIG